MQLRLCVINNLLGNRTCVYTGMFTGHGEYNCCVNKIKFNFMVQFQNLPQGGLQIVPKITSSVLRLSNQIRISS